MVSLFVPFKTVIVILAKSSTQKLPEIALPRAIATAFRPFHFPSNVIKAVGLAVAIRSREEQIGRRERTGTLLVSPLHRLAYSPLVKVDVIVSSSFAFIWSWVSRVFCSAALL